MIAATGIKYSSPVFSRQADGLRDNLEVAIVDGPKPVKVFVKNSENGGAGTNENCDGVPTTFTTNLMGRTTAGWWSMGTIALPMMVGHRFTVTDTLVSDWDLFRVLSQSGSMP